MSYKGFMIIFLTWLTFASLDSWFSGSLTGESNINTLLQLEFVEWKDFLFIPIPVPNFTFLTVMWSLGTLNFFFFNGALEWIRAFAALTIMSGLIFVIYTMFVPIFISLVSAVGTVLRSINPFSS